MANLHSKRFTELAVQLTAVEGSKRHEFDDAGKPQEYVDDQLLLGWCVKARNLLSNACGETSQHFQSFVKAEEPAFYSTNAYTLRRVAAVFMAAKEDYEGGYVNTVRNLVHSEVFDSELEQAAELLAAGYFSAAAVVAGVVLESALRALCVNRGIPLGKLERMNADLAKASEYNSLVQKRITALAAIRNSAAHGNTAEFSAEDVRAMLPEVQRLASTFFS